MAGFLYNVGVVFKAGDRASTAIHRIGKEADTSAGRVFALSTGIQRLSKRMMFRSRMGGVLSFAGGMFLAQRAIRGVITEASRFEVANVQFAKLIGNAEESKKKLLELRTFAAQTPFEFKQSQELSKGLLAMQVSAKDLIPTLTMLGDLGMGDPEKVSQLALAYGKIKDEGVALARNIRMFTTAGVPIREELRQILGTDKEGLRKAISRGAVSFDVMGEALARLSGPGGQFEGMMVRMMSTQTGLWSNFKDNVDIVSQKLGGVLLPATKMITLQMMGLAGRMVNWIDANKEWIRQDLGGALMRVAGIIKGLDVDKVMGFLKTAVVWGVRLLKLFIGFQIVVGIVNIISTAVSIASGIMVISGAAVTAAWAPVLIILLAVGAALYAMNAFKGFGGLDGSPLGDFRGELGSILGVDDDVLKRAMGDANTEAASSTIRSFDTRRSTSDVNLTLPDGYGVESDDATPNINFFSQNLGSQL